MRSFVREALPGRVVFGAGSVERVAAEVAALGCARVLLVAGGSAATAGERVAAALGERLAGRFDEVRQHVPEEVAGRARAAAADVRADGLCSVGGGSATGVAKAVAVALDLPIVAVPTTFAGSEATPIWGVTGERKVTGRDLRALPRTVVYDPALLDDLPARVAAASGLNALAHAAAVLTAPDPDPVAELHAADAAARLSRALPAAVHDPGDLDARGEALYAAHLAAGALAHAGTGPHHRLCHVLGGRWRLLHAEVHAVLLPHTLAWQERAAPGRSARLAEALGAPDAPAAVHALARRLGAPASLRALGLAAEARADALAEAPATLDGAGPAADDLAALLDDAWHGRPPRAAPPARPAPPARSHPTDRSTA